jgi:hypothetical protein
MSGKVVFRVPSYIAKLAAAIAQHRGSVDGEPYKSSLETAKLLMAHAGNPVTVIFMGDAEEAIEEVTSVLAEYE